MAHPRILTPVHHVEPVPRRIRAYAAGLPVLDTTRARYVWEKPNYPTYHVPLEDLTPGLLHPGADGRHDLHVAGAVRTAAATVHTTGELAGYVRFRWQAVDAWFEEDEQVFVHPRDPYTRVDALRSSRHVRVECGGVLLAESRAPVLVFETGLPTRYYLDRTSVHFGQLTPSATETGCPYKGTTSGYWSFGELADIAWTYAHPTSALAPIAGLVAFYQERLAVVVDGVRV